MKRKSVVFLCLLVIVGVALWYFGLRSPHSSDAKPSFSLSGVVQAPAFQLPPSVYMSDEAKNMLRMRAVMSGPEFPPKGEIQQIRQDMEKAIAPLVKKMQEQYPVNITEQEIAGVRTRVITPQEGNLDPERVLINLHGGAFSMCADGCALLESLPMAVLGNYKVVSVDYRMAPEHIFPAANEDVEAVYKALLKDYQPGKIGIYGCSAGGVLTGQVSAWLQDKQLPQPGALGIFGAGAGGMGTGDSAYVAGYIDGSFPAPDDSGEIPMFSYRSYFDGVDLRDPLVSPLLSVETLKHFPPTLIITGNRAMDMSPAIVTHSQLLKAGVKSTLVVGEGMGHCYTYFPMLPEAQDAYDIMVRFFSDNLK